MSRDEKKRSKMTDVARVAFAPLSLAQRVRELVNRLLLPVAILIGAAGLLGLVGCAVLWATPPGNWPARLEPGRLPLYATISLVCASLMGWGCMQRGLGRMRQAVGWKVGGWLFVLLPMLCAVAVVADAYGFFALESAPGAPHSGRFARWYPAALIVLSLLVYLGGQWRRAEQGEDRAVRRAGAFALVLPYLALLSTLVFGVESPLLTEHLRDAVASLGSGAIVLQLAIAYFVSPAAAAS